MYIFQASISVNLDKKNEKKKSNESEQGSMSY